MLPPFLRDVKPVKAGEFCFAMDIVDAAVDGRLPISVDPEKAKYPFIIGMTAIRDYIKDEQQAKSLSLRTSAFSDMLQDERTSEWRRGDDGERLHGAFIMAAAEMPINNHGSFDNDEFFNRVKEISAKHSPEEIAAILKDGYGEFPELPQIAEPQSSNPPRQMFFDRNKPCPCGSGRKHKKCCGRHGTNLLKINQRRAKHEFQKFLQSKEYVNVMHSAHVLTATSLATTMCKSPEERKQLFESVDRLSEKLWAALLEEPQLVGALALLRAIETAVELMNQDGQDDTDA
jgi:hypothetical protein